jgi:DNA-binding response OmpR family regulator
LKANLPDIIISDLMMPVMGGELFFKIRKSKFLIPFVIITASIDDETKFNNLRMGSMIILKAIQNRELVLKEYFKFKDQIERKNSVDPFAKITIKLSEKIFLYLLTLFYLKA